MPRTPSPDGNRGRHSPSPTRHRATCPQREADAEVSAEDAKAARVREITCAYVNLEAQLVDRIHLILLSPRDNNRCSAWKTISSAKKAMHDSIVGYDGAPGTFCDDSKLWVPG